MFHYNNDKLKKQNGRERGRAGGTHTHTQHPRTLGEKYRTQRVGRAGNIEHSIRSIQAFVIVCRVINVCFMLLPSSGSCIRIRQNMRPSNSIKRKLTNVCHTGQGNNMHRLLSLTAKVLTHFNALYTARGHNHGETQFIKSQVNVPLAVNAETSPHFGRACFLGV